ncbi:MAG: metallophosphoesterase, partial [Thermodesulfobacteriota bacterium]|nr:metallophosphoesterase [Thermodesulfobacteriota bacterium]
HIGYTWMGALFLFFSMHFLIDIYNGIIHFFSGTFFPVLSKVKMGNKMSFVITGLIVVGIIIYGTFEASRIKVEKLVLKTEKLPSKIRTLRIAQVSDIHFSAINSDRMARKIVDKIKLLNPDILVTTGDFIDRGLKDKESVVALFQSLKIPFGKYAVTGNHEFYAGIEWAVEFTKKAGFRMLRNSGIVAHSVVNIAGVDDPSVRHYGPPASVSEDEILKKLPPKKLTILLKHQPRINKKSVGAFDLQLSGHTHNGQIFPFSLITSFFFPYHNGLFKVGGHSYLYVSRGTGTWGPAVRFFSPPEITLIEFQRKVTSLL